MFGCLVSGRIVQTNAQQVDANRFVFAVEKANQVQHVAVFLLGAMCVLSSTFYVPTSICSYYYYQIHYNNVKR